MGAHAAVRLVAPLINAGAFVGVTAAWFYDVHVFSPALHHSPSEYFIVAGPYVAVGAYGVVNCLTRGNLSFSIYGLVGSLFIAGCGLVLWHGNFFGSGNDLGFGLGLVFQLIAALVISGMGCIALFHHKARQWSRAKP